MQIGLAVIAGVALRAPSMALSSGPIFAVVYAWRLGTFQSKDKMYVAKMVVGEGEALKLTVTRSGHGNHKVVLSEEDVPGIVWDPDKPQRLIYSESGTYGDGKIAVWNGHDQTVIFKEYAVIRDLRWDRRHHCLRFKTMQLDRDNSPWRQRTLKFK